jgi:hypothetical protein
VLFGSTGTFAWNGSDWDQVVPTPPERISGAAAVYDVARDRTVLFGGQGSDHRTFEWHREYADRPR